MTVEPWQRAETAGTKKAKVIEKPEAVAAAIKRAKQPLFIVGHKAVETDGSEKKSIDYVIRIAKTAKIPVVATAQTVNDFLERGFEPAAFMSAMDIGNRLTDPYWNVSGDNKPHDLALILGLPYYMEYVIDSGLKTFAPNVKTISLDRFYQPHCRMSFPNLSPEEWFKSLDKIVKELEKK